MTFTDIIYGIVFEPVNALKEISQEQPLFRGLITFTAVSLLGLLASQAMKSNQESALVTGGIGWFIGSMGFLFSFINLFLMAGLFSLLSAIFFRKTNPISLLSCLCFSALPGVFGPTLGFAFVLTGHEGISMGIIFISYLWVTVLSVLSLREALELDTGQSILLFFIPPAVFISVIVIVIMGLVIGASM